MFSVVFTPPTPIAITAVFGSYLSNLYLLTCGCGLAYPYDWRGFVGTKKKTSVGLLLLLSLDARDKYYLGRLLLLNHCYLYMRKYLVYIFYAALLKRKLNPKCLHPSVKSSESHSRISVLAFLISHWSILLHAVYNKKIHVTGGFRNNFQQQRRLLEHFSESKAASCRPQSFSISFF